MKLSKLTWLGISAICLGVVVFGGYALWEQTRTTRPVYMRVSMVPGHVHTPEFSVNLRGLYTIEVEAEKRIDFDTLNCLLGMSMEASKCVKPSVIKASWVLTSKGKLVSKGESDADKGGGWANDTISREIGSFETEKGKPYVLDVTIIEDGAALAITDPHLKVEVQSDFYEGSLWIYYYLGRVCLPVVVLGLVLLCVSGLRRLYQRRTAT
jgi:hypothetical protein